MVSVAVAPLPSAPTFQVPVRTDQLPWLAVDPSRVASGTSGTRTATPPVPCGPEFVSFTVRVPVAPAVRVAGATPHVEFEIGLRCRGLGRNEGRRVGSLVVAQICGRQGGRGAVAELALLVTSPAEQTAGLSRGVHNRTGVVRSRVDGLHAYRTECHVGRRRLAGAVADVLGVSVSELAVGAVAPATDQRARLGDRAGVLLPRGDRADGASGQ